MLVIKERHELIALHKALCFIKYVSQEEDAHELAGSPIINQILVENKLALRPFLEHSGITDETRLGWGSIEEFPQALGAVRAHLSHVEEWEELTESVKREVAVTFVQPLSYQEETIMELLKGRDSS